MIQESELQALKSFGLEKGGEYCDRDEYCIFPRSKNRIDWDLYSVNEVNGDSEFIKELNDMEDLIDTYYLLTGEELE